LVTNAIIPSNDDFSQQRSFKSTIATAIIRQWRRIRQ
jgi:hypothetical protein